jgi:S-adenosylmethionine:tRNA ribosyltransferase-isomerase
MRLEELDFDLPDAAVAQHPVEPRDSCRLMHLAADGSVRNAVFSDLPALLRPGDSLFYNDSKVLPARVMARKPTGGGVELLFLRCVKTGPGQKGDVWETLIRPSKRIRRGGELLLPGGELLSVDEELSDGRWLVSAPGGSPLTHIMDAYGRLPLPPYIKTCPPDPSTYQTVYAREAGSAAAPTAGLHFTQELLRRLKGRGVGVFALTLHVGPDTFLPIREQVVEEHPIHAEAYEVPVRTLRGLRATRSGGGRVVAVGTTVTRVLETLEDTGVLANDRLQGPYKGTTDLFITPGHRFRAVEMLLTNFHLPKSTVLALAMAFAGKERLMQAYAEALAGGYRFFSFGDAMLIERLER